MDQHGSKLDEHKERIRELLLLQRVARRISSILDLERLLEDNPDLGPEPNTRADKIGDAVSLGFGEFLVLERDDDALPDDNPAHIEKKIYRFNLTEATDVTAFTGIVGSTGKTVDQLTVAEMVANGIHPVAKSLHVDLNKAGYNRAQKVEGLAVIDPWTLAVINDNDFGVANITIHPDGTFTLNYVPEPEQLGIIDIRLNGLDASDRDNKINIRQWPVKGLYLPDAIASYKSRSHTYLVTANEGDAREYSGFQEAVRIGSVDLDPVAFPDPAVRDSPSTAAQATPKPPVKAMASRADEAESVKITPWWDRKSRCEIVETQSPRPKR